MMKDKFGQSLSLGDAVRIALTTEEGVILNFVKDFRDGSTRAIVFLGAENGIYVIDTDDIEYIGDDNLENEREKETSNKA